MTIKTYKDVKTLDAAIATCHANFASVKNEIQDVLIGIVSHAAGKGNGNVSRAKVLIDGFGDGLNAGALVEWFAIVGIMFDDEGTVSLNKKLLNSDNFTKAKNTKWFDLKKQNPYKGFDLKEQLIKLLKQAETASHKDGDDAKLVSIDADLLKKVEALVPAADRPKKKASNKPASAAGTATREKSTGGNKKQAA